MIPARLARPAWLLPAFLAAASAAWAQNTPEGTAFLPDTAVLVRVDERRVQVSDFVGSYFEAWPEYRPGRDSLGRVQFLNQFVNKEILGKVATEVNHPLDFEERQKLREVTQRAISNTLFQRMVLDSVKVTEADVAALRREYSFEKHMQRIVFADLATALRVRQELLTKKITWKEAYRRYGTSKESGPDGDIGWIRRTTMQDFAPVLFDLAPGQISQPVWAANGVHLTRVLEQRNIEPPTYANFPHLLRREIKSVRTAARMDAIQRKLGEKIGLQFVDSNLVWVASKFPTPKPNADSTGVVHLRQFGRLPLFAPADTGRVIARWNSGQLTLDGLLQNYRETNAFMRQPLNTPALLRANAQSLVLEPYRSELGIALGLDKDPMAVSLIEKKREQMLVDHLYQDSVMSRIRITQAERRKYYDQHVTDFLTFANAQYAVVSAGSQQRADSIAKVIRAGTPITQVMRTDSIRVGHSVGYVKKMTSEDKGNLYYKPLMEELKPGQVDVVYDPNIGYTVVQLLSFDPGRQLTYQEAENYVDESLQNIAAQKLLDELIARHRKRMKIVVHPELVMRIRLVDPLDQT